MNFQQILDACLLLYEPDYIFRQIAEECGELVQASMKYVRALNGETPISEEEAFNKYVEELADVALMLEIAKVNLVGQARKQFEEIFKFKHARFVERIKNDFKKREAQDGCGGA